MSGDSRRMDRSFFLLIVAASGAMFAGTWLLSGESGPPPIPVKTATGEVVTIDSCEEARARGVAPLMSGRPGFNAKLDPDGDGVACPPYN